MREERQACCFKVRISTIHNDGCMIDEVQQY